ncbi:MAG: hypothetical protein LBS50_09155 [Prevotellaceae bacterium]|jgi:hypothetical protein|nr:hypothetical protein [Prevotellaceae bacterium]
MKSIKVILIGCVSVLFVGNLSAQDGETNNKPFKCSKKEVKVCPDTIMGKTEYLQLQNDTANLKQQVAKLTAQLQKPDIDKFLNIQDTAIFGSKFQRFQQQTIPARSRDFYLLIENIHDLSVLLNSKSEGSDLDRLKRAKENIDKALQKITGISSFATDDKRRVFDFLSHEQKQYYRKLVARYNELNEMFNFNSNESDNEY